MSKESRSTDGQLQQKALDIMKKKHKATSKISELKLAEVEVQKRLSLIQQAKYRQRIVEARQQAELQQKVSEARQLERNISQLSSRQVSPSKHAELHSKVSEAKMLQQKITAQQQTELQRRASEERHLQLQQQLAEIRKLRQQLSKVRQTDLQQKFTEAKQAELEQQLRNIDHQASVVRQDDIEREMSEARRIAIDNEKIKRHRELQKILNETLFLDGQELMAKKYPLCKQGHLSERAFQPPQLCHSCELRRSHSVPRPQKWKVFTDSPNVEFVHPKSGTMRRRLSSEKAVQTLLSNQRCLKHHEISSSSTPIDSSSTDDERGRYIKGLRVPGPTAISPRPPSAHPTRRPDLYPKHRQYHGPPWQSESVATSIGDSSVVVEPLCLLTNQSTRSCPEGKQGLSSTKTVTVLSDSRLPRSYAEYSTKQSKEGLPTGANSTASGVGYSSSHEKKISFMVSLPCGDEKPNTSEVSVAPQSSNDSIYSLTDEHMRPSAVESSKSPLPREIMIDLAREGSSIIGHVDSLILLEQGVPEPHMAMTAEESKEVIEKVQAESCIVQHVDSLILIEHSMHQLTEDVDNLVSKLLLLVRAFKCGQIGANSR